MVVTKTKKTGWGERLGKSLRGILIGAALIAASVTGLSWNEGRAVTTARSLDEGAGAVISIDPAPVVSANEGRLVHVTGEAIPEATLIDPDFGIEATALGLFRTVEMYQWRERSRSETETQTGGGQETVTTYTYEQVWSSSPIDSTRFEQSTGHENPPMNLRNLDLWAQDAQLGAFELSPDVLQRLSDREPLSIEAQDLPAVQTGASADQTFSISENTIYLSDNAANPQIGDYRIRYTILPHGPVSVVGAQTDNQLTGYATAAGDTLLLVSAGERSAEEMFTNAQAGNALLTWIARGGGVLALYLGFAMLLAPLAVLTDVIPFLGRIVGMGTGLVAFAAAAMLGSATIALAWLFYRPIIACIVIACGIALAVGITFLARKRQTTPRPDPA